MTRRCPLLGCGRVFFWTCTLVIPHLQMARGGVEAVWFLPLGGFQISFLIFLTQSNPARYVIQKGFKDYCEWRLLVCICVHNESLSIKKVICKGPRNGPPRPPPGKRVMTQVAPYLFHAGPQPPKFVSTRSHNR